MDLIKKLDSLLEKSQLIWEQGIEEESEQAQEEFDQLFEQLQAAPPSSSSCTV
jgi:hypothetical protein